MHNYKFEDGKLIPVEDDHVTPKQKPEFKKGSFGGECARKVCTSKGAAWYNTSTKDHYCVKCARMISEGVHKNEDPIMYLDARVFTENPNDYNEELARIIEYAQSIYMNADGEVFDRIPTVQAGIYSHLQKKIIFRYKYVAGEPIRFRRRYRLLNPVDRYDFLATRLARHSLVYDKRITISELINQMLYNTNVYFNGQNILEHSCDLFKTNILKLWLHKHHYFGCVPEVKFPMFLDDERDPKTVRVSPYSKKEVPWIVCRNYDEATEYIYKVGIPYYISFDHDLGESHEENGLDVAKYIVQDCLDGEPLPENFKWNVHSANPAGRDNINSLLNSFVRFIDKNPDRVQKHLDSLDGK